MRLSPKEIKAITNAFADCLPGIPYALYLFGSRADDSKKGGDIDLLVVVPNLSKASTIELKGKIRNQIFTKLDEQKIDITVATQEEVLTDSFLQTIVPNALLLSEQRPSQQ
jgi:hypothetical protein